MTAAAGVLTGLAKLKRQDSARSQQRPAPAATSTGVANAAQDGVPRKRKRRTDVVVVRGRLRLYSASGFFLLLGLLILAVGIAMATLGYWPQSSGQRPPGGGGAKMAATAEEPSGLNNTGRSQSIEGRPSRQPGGGALTRFLAQHRHSERMKMFGPFTMGIGIFIFICANAILHENRDKETKIIHMRDMYSTVIDIHRLRQNRRERNYARADDLVAAVAVDDVDDPLVAFSSECGAFAGLLAAPPGGARSIVSSSISAFTLPVIKLNNCVIDQPDADAITEEERHRRAPAASSEAPPRLQRSNSASSSSTSSASGCWLSPGAARPDFASDSPPHALGGHSKSLDLERQPSVLSVHHERRKHPSWPRLDRGGGGVKGYARLEDERAAPAAAGGRDYSKREKLLMISRSHNNLSFERDDLSGGAMKRGSSETRF
ncbi:transmembrane protein 200A [Festucalex cinctus]